MPRNDFLFDVSLGTSEMIKRIPASVFEVETDEIYSILDELGMSEEVDSIKKRSFLERMRRELSEEEFNVLINNLYDEYGHTGNRLNVQLFDSPREISLETLSDQAAMLQGQRLNEVFDDVDYLLVLNNHRVNENNHTIDISCKYFTQRHDIDVDEEYPPQLLDEDGEVREELGEEQSIRAPDSMVVEARVYAETGTITVSNSEVNNGIQNDYIEAILQISDDRTEVVDND